MDANSFAEFIVEEENRFGRGKTDLKTDNSTDKYPLRDYFPASNLVTPLDKLVTHFRELKQRQRQRQRQ